MKHHFVLIQISEWQAGYW